ncbi:MAG: tetraacyldisaccharide 4'-kinase [Candidatus Obscuribacterales bacterium]|nr:tetraacyldisaccharide 4'-kinase [Candidatus Obscuribacterales bacterium]
MNLPQSDLARALLKPASYCYGFGSYFRLKAYSKGIFNTSRAAVPVVSIGNITVGGTGKTPITIDLGHRLIEQGKRVGILSRGYKRQSKESHVVVSDGNQLLVTCRQAGDEPYLIALSLPQAVVISGSSRIDSAALAVNQFGCDVLLLDDGFQHVQLGRDLDIVLMDYSDDLKSLCMLPVGRLREPLSGLERASHIVISKIPPEPNRQRLESIKSMITNLAPEAVLCSSSFLPSLLKGQNQRDLGFLKDKKVVAVSGIARPESFIDCLKELQADVVAEATYDDHHWFKKSDIESIERLASKHEADLILTTSKDYVRMDESSISSLLSDRLYALVQHTRWISEPPDLDALFAENGRK